MAAGLRQVRPAAWSLAGGTKWWAPLPRVLAAPPRQRPHAPDLALPQWLAAWIRFLPGRLGSMASMAGEVLLSHLRPAAGACVLLHPPAPVLLRARIWPPALLLSLEAGVVVPIHAAVP